MNDKALEWAKDITWYQIFPDRFRRGNQDNPIKEYYFSNEKIKYWSPSGFSKKWEKRDHWEKNLSPDFYSTLHLRRYLGDIKGIKDSIPYLKKLGVTGIYLNPIFMAPSSHKYDHACLHHVDPYLGSDPLGDIQIINNEKNPEDASKWKNTTADIEFFELVGTLHKNNIRIIIDGVFNHSGRDFFAFQDILKKGKKSKYISWYNIHDFKNLKYDCWLGHTNLPEFARDEKDLSDVVKDYVFASVKRWLFPEEKKAGADGIRLDAADRLPHIFLKELFAYIKGISDEKLIIGELWHISTEYIKNKELDIVMNYPFAYNAFEFFIDRSRPSEFIKKTEELFSAYPRENLLCMQNLYGSHDSSRLSTIIKNPGIKWRESEHFQMSQKYSNPDYNTDKLTKREKRIRKNMLVMQFTFPGAPMIYYGDEVGIDGANDPDCRKPMIWDDILGEHKIDYKLRGFYKRLISIRNKNSALRTGKLTFKSFDDRNNTLLYSREDKNNKFLIAFNNSSVKRRVRLSDKSLSFYDLLKNIKCRNDHIIMQPYSSTILYVASNYSLS